VQTKGTCLGVEMYVDQLKIVMNAKRRLIWPVKIKNRGTYFMLILSL